MTFGDAKKRVEELNTLLTKANDAYYQDNTPFMSDKDFDESLEELKTLEQQFHLVSPDSSTQRVGGNPSSNFITVQHPTPLLSLDNTYNEQELIDFDGVFRPIKQRDCYVALATQEYL